MVEERLHSEEGWGRFTKELFYHKLRLRSL